MLQRGPAFAGSLAKHRPDFDANATPCGATNTIRSTSKTAETLMLRDLIETAARRRPRTY
jgi:hypothetical protein